MVFIYASSDDPEIQKLVDFVNENKFNKSKQAEVDIAIQTLQSKFARDRAGEKHETIRWTDIK